MKGRGEIEFGNKKKSVIGKGIEEEDTYPSESVSERTREREREMGKASMVVIEMGFVHGKKMTFFLSNFVWLKRERLNSLT